jgi:hypothetical protein
MSETLRTINTSTNDVISDRDIVSPNSVRSICVNQINGSYAVVEPLNTDGTYGGRIVIYPQSLKLELPIEIKTLDDVGSLYYPQDAKFDYYENKLWIADTGNDRILKVDLKTNQVDFAISSVIYPHALAVNYSEGGIFVKGYTDYNMNSGSVSYFRRDSTKVVDFIFNDNDTVSSSSSSSESSLSFSGISSSSSSSSSGVVFPEFPSVKSICYDTGRSRIWWVSGVKVYMADIRNKQVKTYDVGPDLYYGVYSVTIELATGNAFVVASNIHDERFILQFNRDNNQLLGSAYVGVI